jgi:CHAT domain-containing protein/Tfp pilus assembly protein PilF
MASRSSLFALVLTSGLIGLCSITERAQSQNLQNQVISQTTSDRKTEADQLLRQGAQLYRTSRYRESIPVFESALGIYRDIKDRKGEATSLNNLGFAYKNLGQYQKAIDFYEQSLTIKKQIGDRNGEATSLNNLGLAYDNFGQYQKAIDFYQQSLAIQKQIGDRNAEATSLNNLGSAYDNLGKYQKAIDFYQQSLAIQKQIGDRNGEARSLNNLGFAYNNLGQYQKAIDFYQQSLAIQKQIGDRKGEATSLNNLGFAYDSLGQYQKAIDFYQQSLALQKQNGDRNGEARLLNNLGGTYDSLGQYQKAIDFYQQSLAIQKQIGDRNGEAASLNNLGESYRSFGQYQKAIDFYQQSLAIFKQIGDRNGEAASLNNFGLAYNSVGQYQKAIDFYQQSLAIKKQIGDRNGEARSLNNLGFAYNSLGQYQKAINYDQQSLSIQKQIGDRNGEATSLNNLGFAYDNFGQYQKAIDFYQQSLAIQKQIGDRSGEATSLNNLGLAYRSLGQYQKAIDFYEQSLAIQKQIGGRSGEGTILSNLGFLFAQQKQPELAILFYKQSVNIREAIRKDIKGLKKEEQQSYITSIANSYRNLADLLIKQDRIMEALQVLDLLKVQELEDYLKNIKGNDRTSQGVRILEPEKAISPQLLAFSFDQIPELNPKLASQIQQIPKSEINKVPEYLQKIPQGSVLIYPLILSDRLEIILFAPNTLPIHRTVPIKQTDLNELVFAFLTGLRDSGSEDVKEPAKKLYNLLIKPIEAELTNAKATTILYAPDQQLRYVPLAALYDGKQWLIEKYRISNLIAYSLSDFSPKTKNSPNVLAGAFGGKSGEIKFGQNALPATITEVRAIAQSLQNTTTLEENDFSRQSTQDNLKQHNILHLATHAEFNIGSPDNSRIFFGNGDILKLNEITDLPLQNIDLIVLSACQTGVGKLGDGVEILGFGYQVQKAGAKNAIASLWKVDDEGTQALMEAFYKELKKGDAPIDEALRKAQVSLIKSPNYNHPNYWSAFFAIGNGL